MFKSVEKEGTRMRRRKERREKITKVHLSTDSGLLGPFYFPIWILKRILTAA